MARWKRALIGAALGVLPGLVIVAIVTLIEAIRGPQEIALTLGVFGIFLAVVGLAAGAIQGALGPKRKRTPNE